MENEFNDLILLKLTAKQEKNGEVTIQAITPVSTVELTTTHEIALQVYSQLGARFLETIESEMSELQGDMETTPGDSNWPLAPIPTPLDKDA